MRYFVQILLLSLTILPTFAQNSELKALIENKTNFKEITTIADEYFKLKNTKSSGLFDDNEFVKYSRWRWYWESRVNADGSFPDLNKKFEIYKSLNPTQGHNKKTRSTDWKNISQTTSVSGYHGMGRLISIGFHPTDTNIFYVGAPVGGIWKTIDGGNSWIPLGDQLPYTSVGNILVDHANPNTIYISIGNTGSWSHYGLGVYKSIDGGVSWAPTTQVSDFTDHIVYYKMLMDPNDANVIYSAQSDGIWKTQDAGLSWYKIRNGAHNDIEFNPANANTIYAAYYNTNASSEIYKSVDSGNTWTKITNLSQTGNNIEIAVTIADTNYVGMGVNGSSANSFYLSTNAGGSFQLKNNNIDNNVIVVISPTTKTKVYCGYVSNHRSNNSGTTWTKFTNWYDDGVLPTVHADNRYAAVNPLQPKYIYYCNDGGLYRFNEQANQWKDLSDGLIITEFYKIASSAQDSVFMIGGTQDNGGRKRISMNSWGATNGGDGMEVAINPLEDNTMYTTYWGGTLYRSYDKWVNDKYHEITPDTLKGAWVTPYMLDPNDPGKLVAGYSEVWVSPNEGDTWTQISTNLTGDIDNKLEVLDVAKSNSNVIYTGRNTKLYYTDNLGGSWTNYTVPGFAAEFEKLSCVLAHPKNENIVYITKAGYGNNSKVYQSMDHGQNWTNISYNIPNIPVNCILIDVESDSNDVDIYIGTDVGVFFKKDSDTSWQYYGSGLPNTEVSDLEIFYPTGRLRAATYGRGIWQTDIVRHVAPLGLTTTPDLQGKVSLAQNPVGEFIDLNINEIANTNYRVSLYDQNGATLYRKTLQAAPGQNQYQIPVQDFSAGIYYLQVSNAAQHKQTFKILKR